MPLKAILFDLDNTLLGNDMDTFMPPYFQSIAQHVADLIPADAFLAGLLAGTRAVIANAAPTLTNEALFWQVFERQTGRLRSEFEPTLETYYREKFPALESVAQHRPAAKPLVEACLEAGYKVVVATNPLFPRIAIEQRLAWAGLPASDYPFALVTTFENMHAAKPTAAYYNEILQQIDVKPKEAMMIGDDWDNDIRPANRLKLQTFWIAPDSATAPAPLQATSRGTLDKLLSCVQSGWLTSFV